MSIQPPALLRLLIFLSLIAGCSNPAGLDGAPSVTSNNQLSAVRIASASSIISTASIATTASSISTSSAGDGSGNSTVDGELNLLPNGGFETDTIAPWQSWRNFYIATLGARSGGSGVTIDSSGGGDAKIDVSPGMSYSLTAWGRLEELGDGVIGYQFYDESWQPITDEVRAEPFVLSYEQRELSFTAPENAKKLKLIAWNGSIGNMYLDDIELTTANNANVGSDTGGNDKPQNVQEPQNANEPQNAGTGSVNNIDTIVSDMALLNDLPLVGVNPSYGFAKGPGFNIMGNNPSGSGLPSWYSSSFPHFVNTGYWNEILPWFVLFHGQGNSATNTRVQMRQLKLYILSRSSNQWQEVTSVDDADGEFCPQGSNYNNCTGGDDKRYEGGDGISLKPRSGYDFHGWYGGRQTIQGSDIKAVFVTLQSRLTVDDPSQGDDRSQARYLFDVGADYYPASRPNGEYLPGVGVSRAKLITNDWQSFNFITLNDVGNQEPGGGISQNELRSNPPPLD